MSETPNVPYRMDETFELPGTPEQVWAAIATANGISSWLLPTEMEEQQGGSLLIHMGEEFSSPGSVIKWEPPSRFAYEETDWALMAGQGDALVSPMATEFLVEAKSGGTCVVRVVTSAFGTGADWEREFFDDMVKNWLPYFDHLRLYLTHFPGQTVTSMSVSIEVPGTAESVWSVMGNALDIQEVGQIVELRNVKSQVEQIAHRRLVVRLTDSVPGYLAINTYGSGENLATASIEGYLFSDEAPAYVEREKAGWKTWLRDLASAG